MARKPGWWDGWEAYSSRLLNSVIWCKEDKTTIIVWVTMLVMSNKKGFIPGNPISVAKKANVSIEDAKTSIERLEADDPDRAMDGHDGRMIERVTGGWKITQKHEWV